MRDVLTMGTHLLDRTGVGTKSLLGQQMRFSLWGNFPLVTTRRLHWPTLVHELLWFLRGETNIRSLQAQGVRIWNEWANEAGELGPLYGKQWTAWGAADGRQINQIAELITNLRRNPYSRRHLISAWNVGELDQMRLPPCHAFFQFHVRDGRLTCQVYQRSADLFLGVPYNIASYALLTYMVAQQTNLEPGELIWLGGDCHIYANHTEQMATQLQREPYPLPTLEIRRRPQSIFGYQYEDFVLHHYQSHPRIKGTVAV